ncbi:VWA domain-containing protein [Flammeovirga pectinis]|uniref:VWA domain-containing protein n=1 Tax=Flammeovirga pectinis TaxID=2494373 RepID=A0A3Q9FMM6_9BACT|nr:VWA domain-containing protein [Flammeovirga pectinis]AZQ61156.1 VWA domain-containing protein [Flammeovirga pectinis]
MNNEQIITYINQFHFLRPLMLWFFVPLVIFLVQYIYNKRKTESWKGLIRKELRKIVILNQKNRKANLPAILMFFLLFLMIIGVAGPTFKQKKLPSILNKSVVWIALDLSQSMLTKDISPNRLERAKLKVRDLFAEKLNTKVGLLVFAGTPHVIFPPSLDKKVMVPYMTTVKPRIMPVKGTNYELMLNYIDTLTQKEVAPATLIIITDEVTEAQAQLIEKYRNTSKGFVQVWVASSFNGGFVPSPYNSRRELKYEGKSILSKADRSLLKRLDQQERIKVIPLTLDNSDVDALADHIKKHMVIKTDADKKEDDWRDDGIYFIYPIIIFGLFWFRKGWMVNWGLVLLIFLSSCGVESKHPDWWYTKDYQAQQKIDNGNYAEAAQLYTSYANKAYAFYKSGDIEAAAAVYEMDSTATSQYNLGLMFVELGNYEMAQSAFRVALKRDPSLTQAKESLVKVKIELEKKNGKTEASQDNDKDTSQAVKALTEKERKLSDNDYNKKKAKQADAEKQKLVDPKKRKYKEQDWPEENKKKKDRMNQVSAASMVMEKTNADPSEFLRKKFILQRKKYYPQVKNPKKAW